MAPVFAKLELGADISMTSATKFISGQSDVTGGILAVKGEQLGKDIPTRTRRACTWARSTAGWRWGHQDMALRMERQQENAMKMARCSKLTPR